MNRRDFLKYSAYIAVAIQAGAFAPRGFALGVQTPPQSLSGHIVAACHNTIRHGVVSREHYKTVLSRFDLKTGDFTQIPIKMDRAHDAIKVHDNYLVIPNGGQSALYATDLKGAGQDIAVKDNISLAGHGYFDEVNNAIIVSGIDQDRKGCFVILDPKNFNVIDYVSIDGYAPHDIQLFDEDTFAICNYNDPASQQGVSDPYVMSKKARFSEIGLYDRKTLALKDKIPAYKNAMVSHNIITDDGDLFAIGFQEYKDENIEQWDAQYIEEKFVDFFAKNHPELSGQWPAIAKNVKIHRVEKSLGKFGLPLLPMKMVSGKTQLDTLPVEHYHHRRAQSICYVRDTNTVCMSYPHSDSVMLYNATTDTARHLNGAELGLQEMRGITEIENTPYLAIAGIRRGITIVDTRDLSIVQNYDVSMGRIVHMHHVV